MQFRVWRVSTSRARADPIPLASLSIQRHVFFALLIKSESHPFKFSHFSLVRLDRSRHAHYTSQDDRAGSQVESMARTLQSPQLVSRRGVSGMAPTKWQKTMVHRMILCHEVALGTRLVIQTGRSHMLVSWKCPDLLTEERHTTLFSPSIMSSHCPQSYGGSRNQPLRWSKVALPVTGPVRSF